MISRVLALPLLSLVLVAAVLGVQVAHGGGSFAPARPADPCAPRAVTVVTTGIDGLGERLVLLGLDGAPCRLGVTREALALRLAENGRPTDAEVAAVRAGLLDAVARMKADGTLPKASRLVDQALDRSSLPGFVKTLIRAVPDRAVDRVLKTDDVLRRTVEDLDLRRLLSNLRDPDRLQAQVSAAVTRAVEQSLVDGLRSLI